MPPERSESPSSAPERVVPPRDERSTGAHALTLSDDDRERFERDGWIGPFAALPPPQARALAPVLETAFRKTRGFLYPDRP